MSVEESGRLFREVTREEGAEEVAEEHAEHKSEIAVSGGSMKGRPVHTFDTGPFQLIKHSRSRVKLPRLCDRTAGSQDVINIIIAQILIASDSPDKVEGSLS